MVLEGAVAGSVDGALLALRITYTATNSKEIRKARVNSYTGRDSKNVRALLLRHVQ